MGVGSCRTGQSYMWLEGLPWNNTRTPKISCLALLKPYKELRHGCTELLSQMGGTRVNEFETGLIGTGPSSSSCERAFVFRDRGCTLVSEKRTAIPPMLANTVWASDQGTPSSLASSFKRGLSTQEANRFRVERPTRYSECKHNAHPSKLADQEINLFPKLLPLGLWFEIGRHGKMKNIPSREDDDARTAPDDVHGRPDFRVFHEPATNACGKGESRRESDHFQLSSRLVQRPGKCLRTLG
jgi:hypothetical protein